MSNGICDKHGVDIHENCKQCGAPQCCLICCNEAMAESRIAHLETDLKESRGEVDRHKNHGAFACLWCPTSFDYEVDGEGGMMTPEDAHAAAVAHNARCPKNPLLTRAETAEESLQLSNDAHDIKDRIIVDIRAARDRYRAMLGEVAQIELPIPGDDTSVIDFNSAMRAVHAGAAGDKESLTTEGVEFKCPTCATLTKEVGERDRVLDEVDDWHMRRVDWVQGADGSPPAEVTYTELYDVLSRRPAKADSETGGG